ncbi:uncharacterized protein LOC110708850 [Chenopodium quinoa]|uniref:uncharacterized protein LOC110708850 n=1 Tax=Chenopodium quinoa TaxID=63459 RepID=UPI000B787BC2|nr:uncharacterized protein LOC110708850 [Chenopodium quinoa]
MTVFYHDAHSIIPSPVGLPDGAKAMATKEGRVVLADDITLEHVLFVPQLNCNLISVSKLIDDSHYFVRFTNSLCAIQDQSSGSLIGGGEWIDGLYYFLRIPKLNKPETIFDSDSRASRILEMIHCDLWGPYNTTSTCGAHYFLTIVDDFSSGVWVYLLNDKTEAKGDKFAPRSRKCVFVGYPHRKKGWKCYDLDTGDIFVSRDVKFHENEFPFISHEESGLGVEGGSPEVVGVDSDFLDDLEYVLEVGEEAILHDTPTSPNHGQTVASPVHSSPVLSFATNTATSSSDGAPTASATVSDSHEVAAPPTTDLSSSLVLDRSQRPRQAPGWHRDYVAHAISLPSPSIFQCSSPTPCSSGTPYPLAHFMNCDKFFVRHRVFIAAIDTVVEPRNFKEAMQDEGWKEEMQKEIDALENNGTWVMEKLPPGKKALGCRWVYKVKLNSDGTLERLKARLVIFGNHQVEGIDYNETFAPEAKMVTVRAFLDVAAAKN